MPSILNATTSSGLVTSADNSGSLQLATNNGTTAVTIDTSQNVGIGTASPTTRLNISGTGTLGSVFQQIITNGSQNLRLGVNSTAAEIQSTGGVPLYLNYGGNDVVINTTGGNLLFNSGYGSAAVAYGCRAWVNFNGTGTVVIRASGNVSSITDNGVGDYTINFTNSMPDANYAKSGVAHDDAPGNTATAPIYSFNQAASNCRIRTGITASTSGGFSNADYQQVQVMFIR